MILKRAVSRVYFVPVIICAIFLVGCKPTAPAIRVQPVHQKSHPSKVSKRPWYTCYVKNRAHPRGLWSGTSHYRFRAKSHAFYRCHRFSGKPATCYFSYCRRW